MFTGLIRSRGRIARIEQQGDMVMTITGARPFALSLGASVAVNGICLTITQFDDQNFTVSLSAETISVTTAQHWQVGDEVNLEPALAVGDALGGHFVSGHVDGRAIATAKTPSGDSTVWEFDAPPALARFIAPKGSVALDGVSLTVNKVEGQRFTVNIIPHTAAETSFGTLQVGDTLNIEIDLLARYAARLTECAA